MPLRIARAVGALLAVALLLLGLQWLASRLTADELRHQAGRRLALLQAKQPLWEWPLRRPGDVVAGRAFGKASLSAAADGLRATSLDGSPFELGLPLAAPVDPVHWPILRLEATGEDALRLSVILANPDQPACLADAATGLASGQAGITVDLRHLPWRSERNLPCRPPSALGYLLRLRLQLPAGRSLVLRRAALAAALPHDQPAPDPSRPSLALPAAPSAAAAALAAEIGRDRLPPAPLIRLPAGVTAETLLALRDRLLGRWPGAVILPAEASAIPPVRTATWPAWLSCVLYALVLAALVLHPPATRGGKLAEAAACVAGPLWLIGGLHLGRPGAAPAYAAFVLALLYAAWISRRDRDSTGGWRWLGSWRAWPAPLALLAFALLLVAWNGHRLVRPLPAHALTYLAWAALQQWLMLAVVLGRLEQGWPGRGWTVAVTALSFALLHTPNGMLMQLCLLAELAWGACFVRWRSLLPIAAAHAGCALLLEAGVAGSWLRSLEVSARFFF